ncbi:MAG TPA: Spy/CpxP family protein refolding chaperone [Vicinamibacterales bacterium]|jgi:protein CpxP
MTTRFKSTIAAGVAALMLAGAAPLLLAQDQPQQPQQRQRRGGPGVDGPRGMRGGPGMEFRGLDLTDDQRAQLRKIREARQSEFKAAGEKLRAAREGMRALIEADSINEPAIRSKSQEVAAAEAEVAILNAKVRAESMQILTSEQQARLKELRTTRHTRRRQ